MKTLFKLIIFSFSFFLIKTSSFADPAPQPETFILREGNKPALSGDGKWVAFECNNR